MKLELIVANEEALKVLSETKFEDAQIAWDLAESFDVVEKTITKFQKQRDEYVKANGKPDPENKDRFQIPDPEAFTKEMQKLLEVNVLITFPKIPLTALKGISVSPRDMRGWKLLGLIDSPVEAEVVEEIKEPVN